MAYMYVCPTCRSFFKAKSSGKNITCPKCAHEYLRDLLTEDEAWGTLTSDEKKKILTDRLKDVVTPKKKVVKKVIKKRIVKKVVKPPVYEPEDKKEETVPAVTEDAGREPVQEKAVTPEPAKKEERSWFDMEEDDKPSETATDEAGEADNKEDNKEEKKEEKKKAEINRKYVTIVSAATLLMILYLITVTFIIPAVRIRAEAAVLKGAEAGDTIRFGKYMGNDEWVVLDRKDDNILCMLTAPLDNWQYDYEGWNDSELRKWLNSKFLNKGFNVFERMRILSTKEIRQEYPDYSRSIGTDEPDKMFIITENELHDYLGNSKEAMIDVDDGSVRPVCWIEAGK